MIVTPSPRLSRIVSDVWRPLTVLFVWDVAVTAFFMLTPARAPTLPLTLFGTALALFLGFRDNSAYQRWWEGRILWGAMINASRSLARASLAMLGDGQDRASGATIARRHIAYVHTLRRQLRRQTPVLEEATPYLDATELAELEGATNVANAILDGSARRIDAAVRAGRIDTIQQSTLERVLIDISNAQGGMERIKNTPLPNQYRFFPAFFTRVFCVLLPIALVETLGWATPIGSTLAGLMFLALLQIADDLTDPFANTVHDVPLSAMCRTIEIDLLQAMGDVAPEPLQPVKGVLW